MAGMEDGKMVATENSELSMSTSPKGNVFDSLSWLLDFFDIFFMSDSPLVIFSAFHQQGLIDTYLFPVPE